MATKQPSTKPYRRDIDGLRAIAVLSVVLYHLFPEVLPGGFVGVDIFFVISGFLISGHLYEAQEIGRLSLFQFYTRRIQRIYPALLIVLASCLLFGWFVLFTPELANLGNLVAASSAFVVNIVLWKSTGYFNTSANEQVLLHLWSLGIEEQYYIFLPLMLLLFRRNSKYLLPVLVSLTAISFFLNIGLVHSRPTAVFFLPITRAWELLAGALLAYLHLKDYAPSRRIIWRPAMWLSSQTLRSFFGLTLIAISVAIVNNKRMFPGWWALPPVLGSCLVISAGPDAPLNEKLLSFNGAVWIGLISYPIYLWHWPLLTYARILSDGKPALGLRLAIACVTVFLAYATHEFVEKPLRFGQFQRRFKSAHIAAALLCVMCVVGSIGLVLSRTASRLPARFPGDHAKLTRSTLNEISAGCKARYPYATDFCRISDENKQPTVLLLGDSHAIHFDSAMRTHFSAQGENLLTLGEGDCLPFLDLEVVVSQQEKPCSRLMDAALHMAAEDQSIHTVVLSAFSSFAITGYNFGDEAGDRKYLVDKDSRSKHDNSTNYRTAMQRTLAMLTSARKHVYVVLDTPELSFDPLLCWVPRPLSLRSRGRIVPCGVPRSVVDRREATTRALMLSVARRFPEVTILDPLRALCGREVCAAGNSGTPFYLDRNHLTPSGAKYITDRLDWTDKHDLGQTRVTPTAQ